MTYSKCPIASEKAKIIFLTLYLPQFSMYNTDSAMNPAVIILIIFFIVSVALYFLCLCRYNRALKQIKRLETFIYDLENIHNIPVCHAFNSFLRFLALELERSERYIKEFSLIAISGIAFEKRENATKTIRNGLRSFDILSVDQNIIFLLLPETGLEETRIIVHRILDKLDPSSKEKIYFGTATYPIDATHKDNLLENTRYALNMAKERNEKVMAFTDII